MAKKSPKCTLSNEEPANWSDDDPAGWIDKKALERLSDNILFVKIVDSEVKPPSIRKAFWNLRTYRFNEAQGQTVFHLTNCQDHETDTKRLIEVVGKQASARDNRSVIPNIFKPGKEKHSAYQKLIIVKGGISKLHVSEIIWPKGYRNSTVK